MRRRIGGGLLAGLLASLIPLRHFRSLLRN
jgi:hypothetical protein